MKLSENTKRAIKNYGQEKCVEAFRLHHVNGYGAASAAIELGLNTRQCDAAINAGRELAELESRKQLEFSGALTDALASPTGDEQQAGDKSPAAPEQTAVAAPGVFVSMTDIAMSGLGAAEGKKSIFIIECDDAEQARIVAKNARKRDEMKDVLIHYSAGQLAYYNEDKHHVTKRHVYELGSRWMDT